MLHIDRQGIDAMLPHRAPLALLQGVWLEQAGESGRATARLPQQEPLFPGFDGTALAQELTLEAAAQALGVVLGSGRKPEDGNPAEGKHLLLGFDAVEFHGAVPGSSEIELRVQREESSGGVSSARFEATASQRPWAQGRVMVMQGAA